MNRRSFFRALGLGAASVAGVTVAAKAAVDIAPQPIYTAVPLIPGSPSSPYVAMIHTDSFGSHNHIHRVCTCGPHSHCMCEREASSGRANNSWGL